MKKTVLLLLLLALAAGGYWYYRKLSTGPEYALMQAYKAATTHDVAAFERYVDVNSVAGHLVDEVADQGAALGGLPAGGLAMTGALRLLKPQLVQAARQQVLRYVETGSATEAAEAAPTGLSSGVSVLGLAGGVVGQGSTFKSVKYAREEGQQALIGLEFTQPRHDTTLVLEVRMQNRGDHWQATEITNAGELLQRVARQEKHRLLGR